METALTTLKSHFSGQQLDTIRQRHLARIAYRWHLFAFDFSHLFSYLIDSSTPSRRMHGRINLIFALECQLEREWGAFIKRGEPNLTSN